MPAPKHYWHYSERVDKSGRSELHFAAESNNVSEIKRLLSLGADVNVKSQIGWTPLHVAVDQNQGATHFSVIKLLLENGADVNAKTNPRITPLHLSMIEGNIKVIRLLLDFKADLSVKDYIGVTALYKSVRIRRNVEIVRLLAERGSDVNALLMGCVTPFSWACMYGELKIIDCLVENGANFYSQHLVGLLKFNYEDEVDFKKVLTILFKYTDFVNVETDMKEFFKFWGGRKKIWRTFLEHVAKLRALKVPLLEDLDKKMLNVDKHKNYFEKCTQELEKAKKSKLDKCWVTLYNLLVDDEKQLRKYAGNQDVIEGFKKKNVLKKYPIYGASMQENVDKGMKTRRAFDKSAIVLSSHLQIFSPLHLVIRDVLDCLTQRDYNRLAYNI